MEIALPKQNSCYTNVSKSLDPIDALLATHIQPNGGLLSLFIVKAFRKGFLSVTCNQRCIQPDVSIIFTDDTPLPPEDALAIERQIQEEVAACAYTNLFAAPPYFALPYAHALEEEFSKEIARLVHAHAFLDLSPPCDTAGNEQQKVAIQKASINPVSIITGGPGTGKTFTAGLWLQHAAACLPNLRVALCAPTGRAVQALHASILRACGTPSFTIDAKTIHSFIHSSQTVLPYHVVIVDECSMIDSALFLSLLKRLHTGVRLIMLGDPDQLPPIDPGQPFIALTSRNDIAVTPLTTCHRTSSPALVDLARHLRSNDMKSFLTCLYDNNLVHECRSPQAWRDAEALLTEQVAEPWSMTRTISHARLRHSVLLTPTRKGFWGTEELNKRLSQRSDFEPIVVVKNTHDLGVMNGDLGIMEKRSMLHINEKMIPSVLCPHIEKAYAMTVHKSQGSEFDNVFVIIPPHVAIDRRLLYTAITRAKTSVQIIWQQPPQI